MTDRDALQSLLDRVCASKGSDRRLDYELFRLFTPPNAGGFWDPAEGNDFTMWKAIKCCVVIALRAKIAELEASHERA